MMNLCRIGGLCCRLAVVVVSGCLLMSTTGIVVAADVADIYQQDVPQMTTLECAKCHLQVFEALRDEGGLHQQQCRDCHDRFHPLPPEPRGKNGSRPAAVVTSFHMEKRSLSV